MCGNGSNAGILDEEEKKTATTDKIAHAPKISEKTRTHTHTSERERKRKI